MIKLESHAEGVILPVSAKPCASRTEVRGIQNGALKVTVTQAAEKGKANKAVRDVLAKSLKLRRSQVELIAGHKSQQKQFLVRDVTPAELLERIAQAGCRE